MWKLILMSKRWYASKYEDQLDLELDIQNVHAHVENGEIVAFTDDLEWFADNIGIEKGDINIEDN